jgi:uncharacterized phiE125 gp8 family phage protein
VAAIVIEPGAPALTLAEAKVHLRLPAETTDEDDYLESLVAAAQRHVETACDITLTLATLEASATWSGGRVLELPGRPVRSVLTVTALTPTSEIAVAAGIYRRLAGGRELRRVAWPQ